MWLLVMLLKSSCRPSVAFTPLVCLFDLILRSISFEGGAPRLLLISQTFVVVFFNNRQIFAEVLLIPLIDRTGISTLCNPTQNIYGFTGLQWTSAFLLVFSRRYYFQRLLESPRTPLVLGWRYDGWLPLVRWKWFASWKPLVRSLPSIESPSLFVSWLYASSSSADNVHHITTSSSLIIYFYGFI